MNISFTGINNIYIGVRSPRSDEIRAFLSSGLVIKNGSVIRLRGQLTDDAKNADLTDFYRVLEKISKHNKGRYINPKNPREVNLDVHFTQFEDESTGKEQCVSAISLNNAWVPLETDADLPMFTFLAKFTKRLEKLVSPNKQKEELVQFANEVIDSSAISYLG